MPAAMMLPTANAKEAEIIVSDIKVDIPYYPNWKMGIKWGARWGTGWGLLTFLWPASFFLTEGNNPSICDILFIRIGMFLLVFIVMGMPFGILASFRPTLYITKKTPFCLI
jgi:hypothetical protein